MDGEERAAFVTGASRRHAREAADRLMDERDAWGSPAAYERAVADAAEAARRAGIYSEEDVLEELEAYLSLPVVGKRRLGELASAPAEHPLITARLCLRCEAEGIRLDPPVV